MIKHNIHQIKVTIHQAKIVSNTNLNSYSLKVKVNDNYQISDKITEKNLDYNKVKINLSKSFLLDLNSKNLDATIIEIYALSRTLIFFDSEVYHIL